jgi:putative hydrolase of the HAD superfamily
LSFFSSASFIVRCLSGLRVAAYVGAGESIPSKSARGYRGDGAAGAGGREREEERYRLSELSELIVYSHEEGMEKPDRRIYEITCERLSLAPPEVLFLDDVEAYVEGARAVGMHAVLYRDNAQAIGEMEGVLGG